MKKKMEIEEKQKRKEERERKKKEKEEAAANKKRRNAQSKKKGQKKGKTTSSSETVATSVATDYSSDIYECSECSQTYNEDNSGEEWVQCACGSWMHEKCIIDVVIDENGKERFCPVCII
uniref:Uncharacterized protein n=1 Tax=Amphimedon queenslandica TaxID=400682 RepID=A0A1X7SHW6_AMPQE